MKRKQWLSEIKSRLQATFGERLEGVVLYGSEARGQADPDSDIDLLVLLQDIPNRWTDTRRCIDSLYPVVLGPLNGRPIHAKPVTVRQYREQKTALYERAAREGIRL